MKAKSKLLTKAEIAAVDDLGGEVVDVPEWGGEVRLAALSVAAAAALTKKLEGVEPWVRLLALCMVGEDGVPIFSEQELGELVFKNYTVVKRLAEKAAEINGMKVGAVGESIKNSASEPGADSSSA